MRTPEMEGEVMTAISTMKWRILCDHIGCKATVGSDSLKDLPEGWVWAPTANKHYCPEHT